MASLTIPQAAEKAGVHPNTMRRRLRQAGIRLHGTNKKFMVTESDLCDAMPEYFGHDRSIVEKVSELEKKVIGMQQKINATIAANRAFQEKAWKWFCETAPERARARF